MSDIKLNISIKEENTIWFKRCIRKLLDSTFIVEEKDEKLYAFISRESEIKNGIAKERRYDFAMTLSM